MTYEVVMMTTFTESDEYIAKISLDKANLKIQQLNITQGNTELEMREILDLYLDAFWVFNDIRNNLSKVMLDIGKDLCELYSCKYKFDEKEDKYYTTCPNMLLHYDCGFSFRGTEKYNCSICGKSIMDCDEHITGELYNNINCQKFNSICNICGKEKCNHIVGEKYDNVLAVKIVCEINLVTFDLVEEPEMKFARVTKIYFEKEDIEQSLQKELITFKYGITDLYCHYCHVCEGYKPHLFSKLFNRKD